MTLGLRAKENIEGFDPRELPGLEAWYDSLYPSGFGINPGDCAALSQWNDLSGKGRHLLQGTATKQPLHRKAGVNILSPYQANYETVTDLTTQTGTLGSFSSAVPSTDWAASGTQSLKVTPTGASVDSFAGPGGISSAAIQNNVVPGKTYTVYATAHIANTLAGFTVGNPDVPGRLTVWYHQASGYTRLRAVQNCVNAPGDYPQFVTVTLPADIDAFFIRLYNGSNVPTDIVYFDNVGILEGTLPANGWLPPNNSQGILFDGIDDTMTTPSFLATTKLFNDGPGTFYLAGRAYFTQGSNVAGVVQLLGTSRFRVDAAANSDTVSYIRGITGPTGSGNIAQNNSTVVQSTYRWQNGADNLRQNSGLPVAQGPGTYPSDHSTYSQIVLGAPELRLRSFNAVIFYSVFHDIATVRRVENWLAARHKATLIRP
jgi:hypothetical protein